MKLIIYGIGDFAELMAYYFTSDSDYDVVAFCADKQYINSKALNGLPIVSFENIENEFPIKEYKVFVAVGYKSMRDRKRMYIKIKEKGYNCANYISSKAILDDSCKIGENCIILQGAILEPFVTINNNCYINTGAVLCHHSMIESNCFIAARSVIGGFSIIKENSFIGFNATILQKLTIAKETLVGAHSLITSNTVESTMYAGIPAKNISVHNKNGIEIKD